jgi:hypothetical protein
MNRSPHLAVNRPRPSLAPSSSSARVTQPISPPRPRVYADAPTGVRAGAALSALPFLLGMAGVPELQPPPGVPLLVWLVGLVVAPNLPFVLHFVVALVLRGIAERKKARAALLEAEGRALLEDKDPTNDPEGRRLRLRASHELADAKTAEDAANRLPHGSRSE